MADHGERLGVIEYLHVLKLAAEETVEEVETALGLFLARAGRWRAGEVRAHLVPENRNIVPMPELAPSLEAYDALLGKEEAHVGGHLGDDVPRIPAADHGVALHRNDPERGGAELGLPEAAAATVRGRGG